MNSKESSGLKLTQGEKTFEYNGGRVVYETLGTEVEFIALTPHCGSTNGMVLLFGERAKLDELRRTDEFERFSVRLSLLFTEYGIVPGLNDVGLEKAMVRKRGMVE